MTTSIRPLLRETHRTTAIAALEVMTAILVTPIELNGKPIAAPSTAPRAAPAETPTSAGSASGFRNEPWSSTPALAKPTPTRVAAIVRGSLMFQITTESVLAAPKLSETAMSTDKMRNRAIPRIQDLPGFFTAQSVLKMRHAMRQRLSRFVGQMKGAGCHQRQPQLGLTQPWFVRCQAIAVVHQSHQLIPNLLS